VNSTAHDRRVLLCASTTGYRTLAFEEGARAAGIELVYATDHCDRLGDAWRPGAIGVRFGDLERSTRDVIEALRGQTVVGVVGLGDRPAVLAAHVAAALGVPWHSPEGATAAGNKLLARGRWLAAGVPVPWFAALDTGDPPAAIADRVRFPCVVKPVSLSGSRGVMRADTADALEAAVARVRTIAGAWDLRALADPSLGQVIVEGFVPGHEYALEGVMHRGTLHLLAIFDKPDPLDGPYFEETIYVTPPLVSDATQRAMGGILAHAALALGLWHGPLHAECRINTEGIFILEIAARPIGGLCARALRFASPAGSRVSLEELLLRHAAGEPLDGYAREGEAAGVMMIPVPARGHYRRVDGVDAARAVAGIDEVVVTARPGQLLEPWPDGHSYPGFIFARGALPEQVTAALRDAHRCLRFVLDTPVPMVPRG
jgi:biotin carboxylase